MKRKNPVKSADRDIRRSWPALLRASRKARKFAEETGTPFYVMKKGKIVNLNKTSNGSSLAAAFSREEVKFGPKASQTFGLNESGKLLEAQ